MFILIAISKVIYNQTYHNTQTIIQKDTIDKFTGMYFISFRINSSKSNVNPYLFFSLGGTNIIPQTQFGLSIQIRIYKNLILEAESGIGKWLEFEERYSSKKYNSFRNKFSA